MQELQDWIIAIGMGVAAIGAAFFCVWKISGPVPQDFADSGEEYKGAWYD